MGEMRLGKDQLCEQDRSFVAVRCGGGVQVKVGRGIQAVHRGGRLRGWKSHGGKLACRTEFGAGGECGNGS